MRRLLPFWIICATAGAHSRMTAPVPRNNFDDIKVNSATHPAPCGGPRSTVVMSKNVGDLITVEWDETIEHPGHYEILFSMANDTGFAFVTDINGANMNNIADVQGGTLPHHYKQVVKLPSTPCAACTLQLKQFMSETSTYYHSCADMELRALTVTPVPDGGTAPSPEPADMATAPQNQPTDPTMQPSDPPATDNPPAEMPDLAVAPVANRSAIGETQYDYSYGCSLSGGSGRAELGWFMMLLSGLCIARIGSRYRSRRSVAAPARNR